MSQGEPDRLKAGLQYARSVEPHHSPSATVPVAEKRGFFQRVGSGLDWLFGLGALFVLASNTLLRPVVNRINREPIDTLAVEVTNTVYVIAPKTRQKEALRLLEASLEAADHTARDLLVHAFGDDAVEIEAVLMATAVDGEELDRLTARLAEHPCVTQAFWSPSTTE